MSSAHRGCCCGQTGQPTPCCPFDTAFANWTFAGETIVSIGFTGTADATSTNIGDGNYSRILTSAGNAGNGGYFDPNYIGRGATIGEAFDDAVNFLAPAPILLNPQLLQWPQCSSVRKPLYQHSYSTSGSAPDFITATHLPWCGYGSQIFASYESNSIFPESFNSHSTPGVFILDRTQAFVETGGTFHYVAAAKVTTWRLTWLIEPFRYAVNQATRWEASVHLTPVSGVRRDGTTVTFSSALIGQVLTAGQTSIVLSLISPDTGNGCPFGAVLQNGGGTLSSYRGTTRAIGRPPLATVQYPVALNASCLRRYAGSQNYLSRNLSETGRRPIFFPSAAPAYQCSITQT